VFDGVDIFKTTNKTLYVKNERERRPAKRGVRNGTLEKAREPI
jgi:hypothetical protein